MGKTIVVYGSSTGTCEAIAGKIAEKLGVESINVSDLTADVIAENDNLLIGTSTWGAGELQDDWYDGVDTLKGADLSGKVVAVFGCGDSASYSDTFCGAMKELYDAAKAGGATVVGEVDIDGYTFDDSDALLLTISLWDLPSMTSTRTTRPTAASTHGWSRLTEA